LEIDQRRADLKAEDSGLSKERSAIEEIILDEWITEGITGQRINGTLIGLLTELRCRVNSDVDEGDLKMTFDAHGLGWLIKAKVHAGSLTSAVKEMKGMGGVPEEVAALIHQNEVLSIRSYGLKPKGQ